MKSKIYMEVLRNGTKIQEDLIFTVRTAAKHGLWSILLRQFTIHLRQFWVHVHLGRHNSSTSSCKNDNVLTETTISDEKAELCNLIFKIFIYGSIT